MLTQFLTACGLGEKEIDIYQALLRLGEASAQQVATQLSRERTSTLRLMQTMVTKGRLGQTNHFHTTYFFAIPLDTLHYQMQESLHQLQTLNTQYTLIQQEANQLQSLRHHDTMVRIYEGISGVRRMYSQIRERVIEDQLIHIKCLYSATFESMSGFKKELSDEYTTLLDFFGQYQVDVQSVAGKGMSLVEDLVGSFGLDAVSEMPWANEGIQIWIVARDIYIVITKKEPQIIHISSGPLANFLHAVVEKV